MIKCEKGTVTIIGKGSDAIAEWAALTAHMVTVLGQKVKENRKVSIEEAIEIAEKPFKEEFERSLIVAKVMNGSELEVETGLDPTTEKVINLIRKSGRMS